MTYTHGSRILEQKKREGTGLDACAGGLKIHLRATKRLIFNFKDRA